MADKLSDIKVENPVKQASHELEVAAANILPSQLPSLHPDERSMSKGEKWFDFGVYQGMYYYLNLGLSLVITDYFMHGKGKNFFNSGVAKLSNGLTSTKMVGKGFADWSSKLALGAVSLNSGGNLLLVPLKLAEDNKRPIVHWLNKKLGVSEIAPDGHEETPDEIHIEREIPRKSWANVLLRRALGMSLTIVTGMGVDVIGRKKLDTPIIKDGKTITHQGGQERLEDFIVNTTEAGFGKVGLGATLERNSWIHRYLHYAALDTVFTFITSKTMELTNGAKKAKLEKEIDDSKDPAGEIGKDEVFIPPHHTPQKSFVQSIEPSNKTKILAAPKQSHTERALTPTDNNLSVAP